MAKETKPMLLTPEIKEKLRKAGALGFTLLNTFKYVPRAFREGGIDKALWPIYTLRSKTGLDAADIEDKAHVIQDGKMLIKSGTFRIETLRHGIVSVKNFMMEDGTTLNIEEGDSLDILLEKMSVNLQIEISNAIYERTVLTKEELQGLEL
jgi:hypothetical protein